MKLIAALCNLSVHGCECADTRGRVFQLGNGSRFTLLISQPRRHFLKTSYLDSHSITWKTRQRFSEAPLVSPAAPPQPPLLLSHPHPVPPHSPDLSVPSDRLCLDRHISHSSSGKHHVDGGLCPEIKQYAVTGRKKTQKTKNDDDKQTNKHSDTHTAATHVHIRMRWACCDLTSKKTNSGQWKSPHFHVASQLMEPWHHMGSPLLAKHP